MSTTDVEITRAVAADANAMRECARCAYHDYVVRLGKEPGPMIDDYDYRVSNNDAYVARCGEIISGLLVLVIDQDRCLLDNVAVHPDYAGNGIGKQLVIFAENRARQAGFSKLELYTHALMTENIAMYQKWGYTIARRIREKGFDRVYMKKSL